MMRRNNTNTQPNHGPANKRGGFTVIEVMVGMLIFAIGILAIGAMHLYSMDGGAQARDMTEASNLAMEQLESFMAEPYDNIAAPAQPLTKGHYTIKWTVDTDADADDTKTIGITVSWNDDNGKEKSISMKHIIAALSD